LDRSVAINVLAILTTRVGNRNHIRSRHPMRAMLDPLTNKDNRMSPSRLPPGASRRVGRILRIATDPTQRLALAATRTLKTSGFSAVRIRTIGGCAFVAGEIPGFGPFVRVSPCPTF
jgi:hypothetical protein